MVPMSARIYAYQITSNIGYRISQSHTSNMIYEAVSVNRVTAIAIFIVLSKVCFKATTNSQHPTSTEVNRKFTQF